jgi:hypothetical protein
MNPRIRELAHEAGLPTYNPDGIPTKLEKFAELIVRECAIVANEHVEEIEGVNYGVGRILKNRFGVTE